MGNQLERRLLPTIATILLVLTAPALAVEWPVSVAVQQDIMNFEASHGICFYRKRDDPDNPGEEIKKECAAADELGKKLIAQGYCIYGKGIVGQPSKDGKHCHEGRDNRIRHDRICDIAQETNKINFNPQGGNAIRLGKCRPIKDLYDLPVETHQTGQWGFWGALNCGYQGYREGKKLTGSPFKNHELTEAWEYGWKVAHKSCRTGHLPFKLNIIKN